MKLHDLVREIIIRLNRLHEGRPKEFLRATLYKFHNPLYALNKIISKAELLQDGSLFIELSDGTKFYGLQDKISAPQIKYGKPQKLSKIKEFKFFGSFLSILSVQYVEQSYEKYHCLREGESIVDMGAHIGIFTVKAAKAVGDGGRVIAIEPQVDNLRFLQRNIEANELKNVIIVPKAVNSKKGKSKLYLSGRTWSHSLLPQELGSSEFAEIEVDTLDNILRELGVKKVDFMKMNIEGAEVEALKGMDEIVRSIKRVAIDAGHIVNEKMTYKVVAQRLRQMGFEVHREGDLVYAEKGLVESWQSQSRS